MMLEAFIGTGDYSSSPLPGTSNSVQAQGGDLAGNGETALQRMLQHLVDERPENWTYVIFWQLSSTPSGDMWVFISLPSLASISTSFFTLPNTHPPICYAPGFHTHSHRPSCVSCQNATKLCSTEPHAHSPILSVSKLTDCRCSAW